MPTQPDPSDRTTAPAIQLRHVSKRYRSGGGITDVSLSVAPGEVYGFLGPNGAGKTTTIRLLLDLIRPDAGTISVLGLDARGDSVAVHRQLGYLPGELALYERLTAGELLDHLASLRSGRGRDDVEPLSERLGLDPARRIGELSKGNKQKVGLVQALMGDPSVLVLDEPTSGLDPLVQREVHDLLRERRAQGCAVLLSSHVLSEVGTVADRVGILRAGSLVATESVDGLRARAVHHVEVRTATALPDSAFAGVPGATVLSRDGQTCRLAVTGPIDPIVKVLAVHEVLDLTVGEPDLEAALLTLYEDPSAEPDAATPDAAT